MPTPAPRGATPRWRAGLFAVGGLPCLALSPTACIMHPRVPPHRSRARRASCALVGFAVAWVSTPQRLDGTPAVVDGRVRVVSFAARGTAPTAESAECLAAPGRGRGHAHCRAGASCRRWPAHRRRTRSPSTVAVPGRKPDPPGGKRGRQRHHPLSQSVAGADHPFTGTACHASRGRRRKPRSRRSRPGRRTTTHIVFASRGGSRRERTGIITTPRCRRTPGFQIAMGLYGGIIVHAPDDPLAAKGHRRPSSSSCPTTASRFAPRGARLRRSRIGCRQRRPRERTRRRRAVRERPGDADDRDPVRARCSGGAS